MSKKDLTTIVDYGMGNLGSIANMLKKIGARSIVTSEPAEIAKAQKLVLPGVGAFDNGMKNLVDRGILDVLNKKVLEERTPILGICLGIQLFTRKSEEGVLPGMGWIDADTVRFRFDADNIGLKVPHMGWNAIKTTRSHPLIDDLDIDPRFYFVHSYHLRCNDEELLLADAVYGYGFPAVIAKDNIMGTQFHPEKSHRYGLTLLKNFVENF